jgi:hypothetical protein
VIAAAVPGNAAASGAERGARADHVAADVAADSTALTVGRPSVKQELRDRVTSARMTGNEAISHWAATASCVARDMNLSQSFAAALL